ncbi:hypothetical protein Vretifemale_11699 [Volvox reticuliferus]|uniref:Uncharacterized protein n=1 Tax=Volvox reticuliferus TaxID=1737510 RepID=A0A8J4CJ58_9CHLO|nr:hypothetical protein Vretifemale_11699 [Volvox reticuliferus]
MGAGCSLGAGKTAAPLECPECPARPAYLACDLVGPPVIEKIGIGNVDNLNEQAAQLAETVCFLNDSFNGLLLDVRVATGLLQGGFNLQISPSFNVDVFTVELLTASGRSLEVAETARIRGQDLTRGGKLAALDAKLAQCLEDLADSFVGKVGITNSYLKLSSLGTLVPKNPDQPMEPVVEAFNKTMLEMRTALGADYLLALHIHKSHAHGMPAFRVRLLKPGPDEHAGTTVPGASGPIPGFVPATLLDQAACLNASRLADAQHAFQDANGRLAAALKHTGLTSPLTVIPLSPRTVCLVGTTAAAKSIPNSATFGAAARSAGTRQQKGSTVSARAKPNAAAVATAAVRDLPAASRRLLARAVEGFNSAVHSLAHAAAAAPGPASFAALLTHVLGELRDVVASAAGEHALEGYQPAVHFIGGPDQAPSLDFRLEPHLEGLQLECFSEGELAGSGSGVKWARPPPSFPDCLSPPVRHAWVLLQELLRLHNMAIAQLESLRQLAAAFDDGLRLRSNTITHDATVARMSTWEAKEAGAALHRNYAELRACWQGALQALTSTALLVRDEMAEAAQLARVQCRFMSPTAWSVSIASTATVLTTPSSGATGSSLSSTRGLYTTALNGDSTIIDLNSGGPSSNMIASAATSSQAVADGAGGDGSGSMTQWPGLQGNIGDESAVSTSICRHNDNSTAKNRMESFTTAAAAVEVGRVVQPGTTLLMGSPPDVACLQDQEQEQPTSSSALERTPSGLRPGPNAASPASVAAQGGVAAASGAGESPSRVTSRATSRPIAADGSRSLSGEYTSSGGRGTRKSRVGWVPLESRADGADGESMGQDLSQGHSPTRPQRPSDRSHEAASAGGVGGRVGGESLADEYARVALAHLWLQEM